MKRVKPLTDMARFLVTAWHPPGHLHVAQAVHHALAAKCPKAAVFGGSRPAAFLPARRLLPAALFDRIYYNAVIGKMKRVTPLN